MTAPTVEPSPVAAEPATHVVALVASAGGLGAFSEVVAALPIDLEAAVVVVLHLHAGHESLLAPILARHTRIPVKQAEPGDRLEPGHIYVAPPDAHLLIGDDGVLQLDQSPPVRFLRPSADLLLASMARCYEDRGMAVVLSGSGNDGAAGASAVKSSGGAVVAQDEATAEYFGMPSAAIANGSADQVLPLEEIAGAVVRFVRPSPS